MYRHFFKPLLDFILSLLAVIVLSPFFLLFTPVVAIMMKGNPFFVQERAGKNGKPFKLIKYRSMTNKKDESGKLLPNNQRITKFGKLLRNLSLDELPQLFNILCGQMSIVGPRPLHVRYNDRYNFNQAKRLLVRPGLTGYAQVRGRNAVSWERKFDMDVYYVENLSFLLDIKILLDTVKCVLRREGINNGAQIGTEDFMGTKPQVSLVEVSESDVELIMKWYNDESIFRYCGGGYHPVDREKAEEIVNAMVKENSDGIAKRYIIETDGHKVGLVGLYGIKGSEKIPELGIYIGEHDFQGKGIATETCLQLENIARSFGKQRIGLKVVAENLPAVRMYKKLGYHEVEIHQGERVVNGKACDVVYMEKSI